MNASKTGTIDYTLDTNVTLPDETRQTSCQIICSLTQFGFREHFVHDVGEILCFPRKLSICRGNIVSGGTEATPPPLLRGTRGHSKDIWVNWIGLGWIGLDCHRMTAIYSLLLFPLFKCQYPCERGIVSTPLDHLQIIEECKTTNRVFPSLVANVGGLHHMPNAI